ncbi:MAG TPA: chorismate mutase [Bacteroidota bacterium]|nr:chorismate mutase [Bacteroidota bacterium]
MTKEQILAEIDQLRQRIDDIDVMLVKFLSERTTCAEEIGNLKLLLGLDAYSPEREKQVMKNVTAVNQGPLSDLALQRLFERIIDESRSAERITMEKTETRQQQLPPEA